MLICGYMIMAQGLVNSSILSLHLRRGMASSVRMVSSLMCKSDGEQAL